MKRSWQKKSVKSKGEVNSSASKSKLETLTEGKVPKEFEAASFVVVDICSRTRIAQPGSSVVVSVVR